jgi:hypothetical protein
MNLNARTKRIEMLTNPAEVALLDAVRGHVDRSSFLRGLMYAAAQAQSTPPAGNKESRSCVGVSKNPASRASVGRVNRVSFGMRRMRSQV